MNDLWIQDIMTQNFLDSDMTRILLLYAITKDNMRCVYKKKDIIEYIYRAYADNSEIAIVNPNSRIRNIKRYGVSDIKDLLDHALFEWKNYAKNDILQFDERNIYINIGETDLQTLKKITIQVCKMLQRKYFGLSFNEPQSVSVEVCRNDKKIDGFGKSIYRNRVLEDMQYCPLCEEVDLNKLCVVHILPAEYCTDEEVTDKNNGIILCEMHAKEYLEDMFAFSENGFVVNRGSQIVDERMHLSLEIKNRQRRNYIKRYYELITNNKED